MKKLFTIITMLFASFSFASFDVAEFEKAKSLSIQPGKRMEAIRLILAIESKMDVEEKLAHRDFVYWKSMLSFLIAEELSSDEDDEDDEDAKKRIFLFSSNELMEVANLFVDENAIDSLSDENRSMLGSACFQGPKFSYLAFGKVDSSNMEKPIYLTLLRMFPQFKNVSNLNSLRDPLLKYLNVTLAAKEKFEFLVKSFCIHPAVVTGYVDSQVEIEDKLVDGKITGSISYQIDEQSEKCVYPFAI